MKTKNESNPYERLVKGRKYDVIYSQPAQEAWDSRTNEYLNVGSLWLTEMYSLDDRTAADALAKTMDIILELRNKY